MARSRDGRRFFGLHPNVFWLGVVSFLNDFSSELIFPLLPLFFTGVLGGSRTALGAMEGLVETTASLLKLASGWLGDRLPARKPLVVGGYALASAARPLLALATAPWHVIALRVTDRVGKGIRSAPRDALIADSVEPGRRGRAFGFHRAMDHLGAIAGPLAGLALIPMLGGREHLREHQYRWLFALAAVPAALSVLVLLLLVRETPRAGGAIPSAPDESGEPGGSGPDRRAPSLPPSFGLLLGILVLFTLGNSTDAFLLARAHDVGLTEAQLYLVWALLHLVKSSLSTPAGALSDRVPRRLLVIGGWLVYAAVYAGFAAADRPWQVWALFAAYGVYFGMVEGTEKALVADLAPSAARSTAFGWYNAAVGIAALPASVLFGRLWDWRGPSLAFGAGSGLALAAALLLAFWSPTSGTPANAPRE